MADLQQPERSPVGPYPAWTSAHFLIFLHIQKTAGMTMQRALRRHFGPTLPKQLYQRLGKLRGNNISFEEAIRSYNMEDRFFAGHTCFGVHRLLPQPSLYMTFLRHPVSRLISLYNYSYSVEHAYYHYHAKARNLEEFITESGLMELDNGQTRFIAGSDDDLFINRAPVGHVHQDLLAAAKVNICKRFFFVGIQERFDESFLLWCNKVGCAPFGYFSINRSRGAFPSSEITPDLIDEIKRRNKYDMELYEFCIKRLDEELSYHIPNMEDALHELRRIKQRYMNSMGRVQRVWSRIRPGPKFPS